MSTFITPLSTVHPDDAVTELVGDSVVVSEYEDSHAEYSSLRDRAGLVDLGGAALILVAGRDAPAFLQDVLARDVEFLTPERTLTSLVLDDDGHIVDVVVVWGHDDGAIVESSVGGGTRLLAHLRARATGEVEITDLRGERTVIAIEGPYSWGVIGRLIDNELAALPLDSVVEAIWSDVDVLFARSGFTGEYGYKMIVPVDRAAELWAVAAAEATPVGNDAYELAMLEVRQPVARHETGGGVGVIESGTSWLVDITKESFVGRGAVDAEFGAQGGRRTVGFITDGDVPAAGTPVTAGTETVGEVVHAVESYGTGRVLGLARLDRDLAAAGLVLDVADAPAETVTSPYVTPKSWSIPIV